MAGKRVVLMGATGMVGRAALVICIDRSDVSMVTAIGRRSIGVMHPKLNEVLHDNFMDYTAIRDTFKHHDLALFCLGAYTGTIPDDEFRKVTVDYPLAFAAALFRESPQTTFCFLSGQGADQTEQSRMAFARYKGAAEKALVKIGFPRVHIFRPGYIYPVKPRKEPNFVYRITRLLYPFVRLFYPNIGVSSKALASAMVDVGLSGGIANENHILENKDIRSMTRV